MTLGIKARFVVKFDGEEHRLLYDVVVVIEGKRSGTWGNSIQDGRKGGWTWAIALSCPGLSTPLSTHLAPQIKELPRGHWGPAFLMSSLGENLTALCSTIKKEDH